MEQGNTQSFSILPIRDSPTSVCKGMNVLCVFVFSCSESIMLVNIENYVVSQPWFARRFRMKLIESLGRANRFLQFLFTLVSSLPMVGLFIIAIPMKCSCF